VPLSGRHREARKTAAASAAMKAGLTGRAMTGAVLSAGLTMLRSSSVAFAWDGIVDDVVVRTGLFHFGTGS